ncbi:hypothetical protein GW17_00013809 [Ensete ventricosum]|nr:hypothetical protein GW17_00013809 [Ensete ventricosum]
MSQGWKRTKGSWKAVARGKRRRRMVVVDWEAVDMLCSLEFWRMAVCWTLSLLYSHLYLLLAPRLSALFPSLLGPTPPRFPRRRFAPGPSSPIQRPLCVVTGASSGLGAAAARALAAEGYHVILGQALFAVPDYTGVLRFGRYGTGGSHTGKPSDRYIPPIPGSTRRAADPGAVATNIMRELPPSLKRLAFLVLGFLQLLQSPEIGVDSIIDAALAPPEASGRYFFGAKGRTIKSSPVSYDARLAETLWLTSFKMFEECKARVVKPMKA